MTGLELKRGRLKKEWDQEKTAQKLGVSQTYLSLLEAGKRPLTDRLARRAAKVFDLPAVNLPMKLNAAKKARKISDENLATDLATLGYPKFSHLKKGRRKNPAGVLLAALASKNLDARVAEALPWLVLEFSDIDWRMVVSAAKLNDLQNRLGFVTSLAREMAEKAGNKERARLLSRRERGLERSLLAREDTFCRESLTETEKRWLLHNRPERAKRWRLLTDLDTKHLLYAA